ncbi:MAG: DUF2079 domain-containing protein [Candidatus Omnitrophica bacterium]|nr:DUF2079 domain-containing protein [Candidatus Omnitrophota bacterium]
MKLKDEILKKEYPILTAILILFSLQYFFSAWAKLSNYVFGAADTGILLTSLWQAGHFEIPVSYAEPGEIYFFLGKHFMPMGFLYGFFFRFLPFFETGLFIHAISFLIAGIFVYLLVREITKNSWVSYIYLLCYLTVYTPPLSHFYFENWATPYLAGGLYFLFKRKYGLATVLFLLGSMFKEYISLCVAALGVVLLIKQWLGREGDLSLTEKHRRNIYFIGWFVGGLLWFVVSFFWIMEIFEPNWSDIGLFSTLGSTKEEALTGFLKNPIPVLMQMIHPVGFWYFWSWFGPLAFLPFIGFEMLLAVTPIVLLNFLASNFGAVHVGINDHYTVMLHPFIMAAGAVGWTRLSGLLDGSSAAAKNFFLGVILFIIGTAAFQGARYHLYQLKTGFFYQRVLALHTKDIQEVIKLIPSTDSVSTEEPLIPFFSFRKHIVHEKSMGLHEPSYLLWDLFYRDGLSALFEKGKQIDWKIYDYPPDTFYSSAEWETKEMTCGYEAYEPVSRTGSLLLCRKKLAAL